MWPQTSHKTSLSLGVRREWCMVRASRLSRCPRRLWRPLPPWTLRPAGSKGAGNTLCFSRPQGLILDWCFYLAAGSCSRLVLLFVELWQCHLLSSRSVSQAVKGSQMIPAPHPCLVCLCTFAPSDWMMGRPGPSDFARLAPSSSTAPLLDSLIHT